MAVGDWITIEAAAARLNVSEDYVLRLIHNEGTLLADSGRVRAADIEAIRLANAEKSAAALAELAELDQELGLDRTNARATDDVVPEDAVRRLAWQLSRLLYWLQSQPVNCAYVVHKISRTLIHVQQAQGRASADSKFDSPDDLGHGLRIVLDNLNVPNAGSMPLADEAMVLAKWLLADEENWVDAVHYRRPEGVTAKWSVLLEPDPPDRLLLGADVSVFQAVTMAIAGRPET